jgi:hypothetical protein
LFTYHHDGEELDYCLLGQFLLLFDFEVFGWNRGLPIALLHDEFLVVKHLVAIPHSDVKYLYEWDSCI